MVFGEQVFEGESLMAVPAQPGRTLIMPLAPARDVPVVLMIKALVGSKVGWGGRAPGVMGQWLWQGRARRSARCARGRRTAASMGTRRW